MFEKERILDDLQEDDSANGHREDSPLAISVFLRLSGLRKPKSLQMTPRSRILQDATINVTNDIKCALAMKPRPET
jgi:hypothetical protein